VLAQSFARLHRANLINFGVLPVLIRDEEYEQIEEGDYIELVDVRQAVAEGDKVVVKVGDKGLELAGRLELSPREHNILLAGGSLSFYRQKLTRNRSHR
jgi:aconitate hydratase